MKSIKNKRLPKKGIHARNLLHSDGTPLVRVVVHARPRPVNRRVAPLLGGLHHGRPVEDRLVVLGVQLHEESLPLLNELLFPHPQSVSKNTTHITPRA